MVVIVMVRLLQADWSGEPIVYHFVPFAKSYRIGQQGVQNIQTCQLKNQFVHSIMSLAGKE